MHNKGKVTGKSIFLTAAFFLAFAQNFIKRMVAVFTKSIQFCAEGTGSGFLERF